MLPLMLVKIVRVFGVGSGVACMLLSAIPCAKNIEFLEVVVKIVSFAGSVAIA